jgi:hypothetical protein
VPPEFDDLVDGDGLSPEELARLRSVHELLVEAGPPAELPPALEHVPDGEPPEGEILQFPLMPKRRWIAAGLIAAAFVLAAFGAGYLVGDRHKPSASFETRRVIPMTGKNALASIRAGYRDEVGNWPMEFVVSGLPKQPEGGYYDLYLTRGGRPLILCGSFRVKDRTTTVRFTVPYRVKPGDGWVVTAQPPGHHEPGRVVLST